MKLSASVAAIALSLLLASCAHTPAKNPDPNHTHADFAVWIDGKQLDFSGPEYMEKDLAPAELEALKHATGALTDHSVENLQKYLHLHDGNGHVIHRHKPGLTVLDFFRSLGIKIRTVQGDPKKSEPQIPLLCIQFPQLSQETCETAWTYFNLYTNDPMHGGAQALSDDYSFYDGDHILISIGDETKDGFMDSLHQEWLTMTYDSCLYSKTCPWRGKAPTENCIADPNLPCTQ